MWTVLLVSFQKKNSYPCRVCANGAACKYVKCFQTATGWREARLGVKVHFDVCASAGAWEPPRARGRGVPRGISPGCFNWIFSIYDPSLTSPDSRSCSRANERRLPGEPREEGGIRYTEQTWEKHHILRALNGIHWWKTWGWERRLRGHYKDYKENPAPVLGAAGEIKINK